MKLSLGAKTAIGVSILLGAMVSSGVLTLTLREQQLHSRLLLIRTYKILNQLELVIAQMVDAETGQRGFLLTGDIRYLAPYHNAVGRVNGTLTDLESVLEPTPSTKGQLKLLRAKSAAKLEELERSIKLRRASRMEECAALLKSGLGERLMSEIRQVMEDMHRAESIRLVERTRELDNITVTTTATSMAFTGISLVSVLLTGLLLNMFLVERRLAEQKLSERSQELEKNQRELNDLFDNAQEGIQWIDSKGVILKANRAELLLLGYRHSEYIGHSIAEFHAEPEVAADILSRLNDRDELHNYSARLKCKDGTIKHVEIDANVYCENEKIVHCRCFTRDVSAQKLAEAELREREARNRAILDTAPDAILIVNADGTIESANKAATEIFAMEGEKIPGCQISDLIPDFYAATTERQPDLLTTGSNKFFGVVRECTARRPNDTQLPVDVSWSVLNLGNRTVFTLVIRDISRRKSAENKAAVQHTVALLINEAQSISELAKKALRFICQRLGFIEGEFWQTDENESVIICAEIFYEPHLAGSDFVETTLKRRFNPGEGLPGRVWKSRQSTWIKDLSTDNNFPRAEQAAQAGVAMGMAVPLWFGEDVPAVMAFYGNSVREQDTQILETMTTIGIQLGQFMRRKTAEDSHTRQRMLQELMLDTMSDGIVAADQDGRFIIVNRAAEEMFGPLIDMDPAEWSAHYQVFLPDEKTLFPPDDLPLARALRGEAVNDVEIFVNSSAGRRSVSVTARPVSENQLLEGGMAVCRDITERKAAEKRVSEFYSTVSHELRTPLTSIRGSLGLIEGGLAGEIGAKCKKLITIALAESDRLIRLINDILDIRKIEAGMMDLKISSVAARNLIEQTIENIRGMSSDANVKVTADIQVESSIDCDPDRIIQVLTNLVGNAIKFSKAGDTVLVRLGANERSLRFSVIDTGPGIEKEQLHKLFGKFQQIDQSDSRQKGGTGLGLAVSKAIVEHHRGKMGVESEFGVGSTFWFELTAPLSTKQLTPQRIKKVSHPALVIEDDDHTAEILSSHLEFTGFQVVRASTMKEARSMLAKASPLVIILDLMLPDGHGLDLLRDLSLDPRHKHIPVVIVTACERSEGHSSTHPLLIEWICKPFSGEKLNGVLEQAKERLGPARVLIVEDDIATRTVLKEQLEPLGIRCFEAGDGIEAVNLFRSQNPDLIILDLQIPPPDGFSFIEILRHESNGMKPLIVYTASDLTADQKAHLQLGQTAHLTKSTTTQDQLLNTVRDFLNGLLLGKANAPGVQAQTGALTADATGDQRETASTESQTETQGAPPTNGEAQS